ncbi:MAG: ANTAR domain-containing protein [Methylocystis sp.]|nr:ANTAR domain-containing protein [Methylocystis sp.]
MDFTLTILLVDESSARAAIIEDGLREAGFANVVRLDTAFGLMERIKTLDPDVIIIDLANPQRDALEQMFQVSRLVKRPITMFVDRSDSEQTRAAIAAGVSAYIVDGLEKSRVKHVVELCVTRFHAFARLESELAEAKNALDERRLVDRAKAILMRNKNLDEPAAYALLRRSAMNHNKRIVDIARAIVDVDDLMR